MLVRPRKKIYRFLTALNRQTFKISIFPSFIAIRRQALVKTIYSFQILSHWLTMATSEQPEMKEVLDFHSSEGTLSSSKFMPTSSSKSMPTSYPSVIYAPFTYPLSSLMRLPPVNSLVNIKDQALQLSHPMARLDQTSQTFSNVKVEKYFESCGDFGFVC